MSELVGAERRVEAKVRLQSQPGASQDMLSGQQAATNSTTTVGATADWSTMGLTLHALDYVRNEDYDSAVEALQVRVH